MTHTTVPVWDIAVRLFHWSLVASFTIAYFTGEDAGLAHIYSGYAVLGLVLFRLLWGFVGTRHARFRDFVYSPSEVVEYLKSLWSRSPRHYLGHNPAGGWMVLALLASLLLTTVTGLKVYGIEGQGPLADGGPNLALISSAYADDAGDADEKHGESEEKVWEELHEFFANFTLLLIFMHVTGVIVSSWLHRENLVKAMISGRKSSPDDE
jgi:cytochrome b